MAASAGWKVSPSNDSWLRWWTGKEWSDSYWPSKLEPHEYRPESRRLDISSPGEPRYDIVGENWRSAEILAAIGRESTPRDAEFEGYGVAELIPEPDNPFDQNAVSVRVGGYNVGYFPAEDSRQWIPVIQRFLANDIVPTARVRIWGVTRFVRSRGQDELKSAIRLALTDPASVLPSNSPPIEPHFVIPRGRSIQVTGEADHLDALAFHASSGKPVIVTLHQIEGKTKTSGTVLEVRLDGRRVGQLTPGTSTSLMPLVNEAQRLGRIACAWAAVTGSRLAAEVTIRAIRAEEAPDSWPSEGDSLPQLKPGLGVPTSAYREQVKLAAPPAAAGLSAGVWIATAVAALILAIAIPVAGWIIALLGIGAIVYFEISKRRKPPTSAHKMPSTGPEGQ